MFYSYELLTSRKHGVATVWLVATLGSKSNLKKVTRKAILDVDIPKACDTITDPEAPLALRLQASLLYGVSRVHSQQCNYVLSDTQSFRDNLRGITQVMKELEIDPDAGRTRPDQLNIPEDPGFIPDLDLNFDLSAFDIPSDRSSSRASSVLSPHTPGSSRTSLDAIELEEEADMALDIPSLDTPSGYGGFTPNLRLGSSVGIGSITKATPRPPYEESPIIDDPEFEIAEDGSLVAVERPQTGAREHHTPAGRATSESVISARVRDEHAVGSTEQNGPRYNEYDDGMMVLGEDDESRLPPALPFPTAVLASTQQPEQIEQSIQHGSSPSQQPQGTSTETAEAPQRRARPLKRVQMDLRTELQNKDLGDWSNNYLDNMRDLTRAKNQTRSTAQAKRNAAFWVLGQGLGRVQTTFGEDRAPHPLAIFSGQALLDALLCPDALESPTGSKRSRSRSADREDERRVRTRVAEDEEIGRGADNGGQIMGFDDDDDGIIMQGDDFKLDSEIGRRAGSSISDVASILPWNRSTSRQGSAQPFGSAGFGISSSIGGPRSGMKIGFESLVGGIRSRLYSASPLVGKGRPLMDLDDLMEMARQGDMGGAEGLEELASFEQYGPAAAVDTQTAAQSQWMRVTLENEAQNFLDFVEAQLLKRRENGEPGDSVTLDELLPPMDNTGIVAAQALLHVLSLTTKGLLEVEQEEAFGAIVLNMVYVSANSDRGADGEVGHQPAGTTRTSDEGDEMEAEPDEL